MFGIVFSNVLVVFPDGTVFVGFLRPGHHESAFRYFGFESFAVAGAVPMQVGGVPLFPRFISAELVLEFLMPPRHSFL